MRAPAAVAGLVLLLAGCDLTPSPRPEPTAAPAPVPQTAAEPQTPGPGPTPLPHECLPPACFDVDGALKHVRVLAEDIGPREAGSEADLPAAEYIFAELRALGLDVSMQDFQTPAGASTRNVIGVASGTPMAPGGSADPEGPYLLLGAHFDTVAGSPGANDNASGTGAMLEIARALGAEPASLPVVFVAFGAEERQPGPPGTHHIGSRHYVEQMPASAREHLVAMLNLDMIGWGEQIYAARMSIGPQEATQRLLRVGGQLHLPVMERVTPDWSDNGPFLRAGLNAGWLWAGEDPRYHSPRDTFDHLQARTINWAGAVMLATIRDYP